MSDPTDTMPASEASRAIDPMSVRAIAGLAAAAMTDDEAYARLPIPIRALMAALALAATGRRLNKKVLAEVGRYSRTTAQRKTDGWTDEIDAFVAHAGDRVQEMLQRAPEQEDAAKVRAELDVANRKLGEARARIRELEASVNPLVSYAHDLTRELRGYREEERAKLERTLVPLRRRPTDEPDTDGSDPGTT